MKKRTKAIIFVTAIVAIATAAGVFFLWHNNRTEPANTQIRAAKIADLRPMVQLCTVEFYQELPLRGSIGPKHIFARTTLEGSIGFDLDSIEQRIEGDTLVVELPREIIDIKESTAPGSYEVFDTWNDRLLSSGNFTTDEENTLKRQLIESYRNSLYTKGYVRKARREAVSALTSMLAAATGTPVRVVDPTPDGRHN